MSLLILICITPSKVKSSYVLIFSVLLCFLSLNIIFDFSNSNILWKTDVKGIFFLCAKSIRTLFQRKSTNKAEASTKSLDKYITVCFPNYCCSWKWESQIESCTIYIVTLVLSACDHPGLNKKGGYERNRKTNYVFKHKNTFNN